MVLPCRSLHTTSQRKLWKRGRTLYLGLPLKRARLAKATWAWEKIKPLCAAHCRSASVKKTPPRSRHCPKRLTAHAATAGRGDWKFKASWLSETRDYNNLKMVSADPGFCRRCLSGSDVSSGHWLDAHGLSFYRPDDVFRILDDNMAPSLPLRRLPGWSPDMEAADTLHNCWMGPVKECVASILMDIAQFDPRYTAYSVWDDALMAILHNFHAFCENHGLDKPVLGEISLVKLGAQALQFDFPSGFSKAYANRILMLFVAHHLKATAVPELQLQATYCRVMRPASTVVSGLQHLSRLETIPA